MNLENEKTLWEFYLHKVFDKSFEEFKNSISGQIMPAKEDVETTVKNSMDMLQNFNPNS